MRAFLVVLGVATAAGLFATSCEADVDDGCLTGGCLPPEQESLTTVTAASGTGSGGAGGEGGGVPIPTCDIDAECPVTTPGPTTGCYPPEVFAVLDAKCHRCHQDPPQNGAPFSLLDYAKTQELYGPKTIYARMYAATTTDFMPLTPPDLTDEELAVLTEWLCQCAPSADTCP